MKQSKACSLKKILFIVQLIETRGRFLAYTGTGFLWYPALILAEMVQTFILADFCYYYVKRCVSHDLSSFCNTFQAIIAFFKNLLHWLN